MDRRETFDLEDLNDEFMKKVVYIETKESSGLGGTGYTYFITEDGTEYYLGYEDLPFSEWDIDEYIPLIKIKGFENGRPIYEIEDKGWHYLAGNDALIRGDIWDVVQKNAKGEELCDIEKYDSDYVNMVDIIRSALGIKESKRVDYIRSAIWQENFEREQKRIREEHEKNKLLDEHFIWHPIHPNNIESNGQEGIYALLFTEDDGRIKGVKFSIIFQKKQDSPMCQKWDSEIELYNLFVKDYEYVTGQLYYPPYDSRDGRNSMLHFYERITLDNYDINSYGGFLRSFNSLDEAKEYTICYANSNSHRYGDRNTIIKDTHNEAREYRLRAEKCQAYIAFRKYYKEIFETVCNFDGYESEGSGGGGFIIAAVLKAVPQITKRQLEFIWHDIPLVLEARTQRYIKEELQNCIEQLERIGDETV